MTWKKRRHRSQAFAPAERAARAIAWDIVAVAPQDLRIEATDTTLLFGFKDDIVIRVTPGGNARPSGCALVVARRPQ